MLIIGESHIFRLNNFYTQFHNTTLYLQPNITDEEMVNDILNSAQNNEVEVFTFTKTLRSTFLTEFEIYGSNGVEKYINKNLNIFNQEYKSLFLGNIRFEFNEFKTIPDMENINDFYVIGEKEKVNEFKMELIDKYAGNHPKEGYKRNDIRNNIIFIWFLIISIILLLTFYDAILQKKENLIRISMGESINIIFWKNIFIDSFVLVSIFLTIIYILSKYTHVFFRFDISLIAFIILLISNSFIYLNLYFYNIKEVFSNSIGSKKLLSLNYSLKLITSVLTTLIISSNLVFILDSYNLYKQKSFFQEHDDYYYTRLEYKPTPNSDSSLHNTLTESAKVQANFYREFFKKFNAISLVNISNFSKTEGILANKNSYDYLSGKIKKLNEINLNKDFYFILPQKMKNDSLIIQELKEAINFYEGDSLIYNYEIIYYNENIEIISIDENYVYRSDLVKNPVILYNNMSIDILEKQPDDSQKINYVHDIMYKISDDEFNKFVADHNLTNQIVSKTNVFENYENKWIIAKRILYMNFVFSILVLALEFIIINSIIKLEYEVNAIELAIKKVIGHSIFEKHRKIILITIVTTILSILTSVIIAWLIEFNKFYYLILAGMIILFLEYFLILFYIHKTEKGKIQKILKGGNI